MMPGASRDGPIPRGQGTGRARVRCPARENRHFSLSPTPNFCEERSLSLWKIPFAWQKTRSLSPAPPRHQFPPGVRAAGARPPARPGRAQLWPGPAEPVPAPLSPSSPRGGRGCSPAGAVLGTHGPPCHRLPKRRTSGLPGLGTSALGAFPGFARLPQRLSRALLVPAFPAEPARHPQHTGPAGGGAAGERPGREQPSLPSASGPPVCATRLVLPSALRPPLWPPWHSQSPAQLSLVPSGSYFLLFPGFPLPRCSWTRDAVAPPREGSVHPSGPAATAASLSPPPTQKP